MLILLFLILPYWEQLPPMPESSTGHSEASIDSGDYYVFGIHPSGVYSDTTFVYDIENQVWLGGPKNIFGCGAHGVAYGVNGKYYRIGGTDVWPTPLDRVDIYDPNLDFWSAGSYIPIVNMDMIGGVYKDSLIFIFGGGNWSVPPITDVYFYDTYNDTWTPATSFPAPGRGAMAGGIIDSFVVLAFGHTGGNNYSDDYIIGIIDQASPANITWSSWVATGAQGCRRVPSGVDHYNKELWVIGGQVSGGQLNRALSYSPYTDTWTDWSLPSFAVADVTPLVVTPIPNINDTAGLFIAVQNMHWVLYLYEVGVEEYTGNCKSQTFGFVENITNPTREYCTISYTTTKLAEVNVRIFDNSGELIRTLVNRPLEPAGTKTIYWNGKDNYENNAPNGIYFIKLEAGEQTDIYKLILVR